MDISTVCSNTTPYRGRFAPTPSGPLHFGSVIAALGSYLEARSRHGEWLVRIEDLDQPRMRRGAADSILRDLERLGLEWDNEPVYQSRRLESYQQALQRLQDGGHTFDCGCTRREVKGIYAGTCRNGLAGGRQARSVRLRVPDRHIEFTDRLQGPQSVDLFRQVGDFIIRRADHIIAYHLAVVIDDADTGITDIVRGADLLDSTAPQILLQQLLDYPTPEYLHLPVALGMDGRKISKQNHAAAIADQPPAQVLWQALNFLGQEPDPRLAQGTTGDILTWAGRYWNVTKIPLANRQPGSPEERLEARP
ncbi:MAG: tRNA glutamyl-Q(34) synthetase GluQRS [Gammaproteobacteria bacterium]|nr:tRNA glutamyl-Q(34) synthetase GluQRS [Gammaproteobacteria bacterium]